MSLKSINPATEELLEELKELSDEEVVSKIDKSQKAFEEWRKLSYMQRAVYMQKVADLLKKNAREYGEVMAQEMGKPITAAIAESEKCGWVCEFYAEKTEEYLKNEITETDASESYVQFDPLGIVLAVMPWNYPFWQLLRAAAPIIMAGNTILLKHASNVPRCGIVIEQIFRDAGFPEGVMQNLLIGSSKVAAIIEDDRVKAATLTGSEYAGSQVAGACGKEIKKTVLELGGSDPFIVLDDADIDLTCKVGVNARFQNGGQSCIAAKRFIIVESRYDEFMEKFLPLVKAQIIGDPMSEETTMGPWPQNLFSKT